eukprot:NODE_680_length_4796_cov_0.472855.p5 type:complete len:108 gc:universal NODE_680_length_4796_cov_0.472855:3870-3547(-)
MALNKFSWIDRTAVEMLNYADPMCIQMILNLFQCIQKNLILPKFFIQTIICPITRTLDSASINDHRPRGLMTHLVTIVENLYKSSHHESSLPTLISMDINMDILNLA